MVKALDRLDPSIPTVRWIGEVYEIDDERFTGVLREDFMGEDMVCVGIPISSIIDSEKPRIVKGILFYCDVELEEDGYEVKNICSVEFDDELTLSSRQQAAAMLLRTIALSEERYPN